MTRRREAPAFGFDAEVEEIEPQLDEGDVDALTELVRCSSAQRRGRILALLALFEADTGHHDARAALGRLCNELRASNSACARAQRLVSGVLANSEQVDAVLQRCAPTWPLPQVAAVDRNILRLAIYEVLFARQAPVALAVNEAVELAKVFGSDHSARFVNGVLGAAAGLAEAREPSRTQATQSEVTRGDSV